MSKSQTDDQIAETLAKEIDAKEYDRMEVLYAPLTVFQLTALIQLALRHPGVTPEVRAAADRFLSAAREYFADSPTVMDVIRRGDDPSEDR